jgi:PAS domain S-box-containing protein
MEEILRAAFGDAPYRKLVEEIRDFAILHLDREGRILSLNAGAASIFGYEEAEAIGNYFSRIFTRKDAGERRARAGIEDRDRNLAGGGHALAPA